jgi:hypothetical protein
MHAKLYQYGMLIFKKTNQQSSKIENLTKTEYLLKIQICK